VVERDKASVARLAAINAELGNLKNQDAVLEATLREAGKREVAAAEEARAEKRRIDAAKAARVVDDDDDDLPAPPGASFESPMPWETDRFVKEVQEILDSVEAPPVDDTRVYLTLQKHLYRSGIFGTDGRGQITLLIRTMLESENNGDALIEPIVSAVSCCMRPEWTGRGLQWIEAFDQIPLVDILTKLRDLDLFPEKELEQHYAMGIQRRLWRITAASGFGKIAANVRHAF
jgi:hypothetical protein